MEDNEIREYIRGYVFSEMYCFPDESDIPEHPPYSRRFDKKMKKIIRIEKYFGGNINYYTIFSRVAAAILIVLSLSIANQVSAAVFGFNPWITMMKKIIPDVEMEEKVYKPNDGGNEEQKEPVSYVPTYIPYGFEETYTDKTYSYIRREWSALNDNTKGIIYTRHMMSSDSTVATDFSYDTEETVNISGYIGKLYTKNENEAWVEWFDKDYRYVIEAYNIDDYKIDLKRMSESIYQKK